MTPEFQTCLFYTFPEFFALRKSDYPLASGITVDDNWFTLLYRACAFLRENKLNLKFTHIGKGSDGQLLLEYQHDSSMLEHQRAAVNSCLNFTTFLVRDVCDSCNTQLDKDRKQCFNPSCRPDEFVRLNAEFPEGLRTEDIGEITPSADRLPSSSSSYFETDESNAVTETAVRPYFDWETPRGSLFPRLERDVLPAKQSYLMMPEWSFHGADGWKFKYTFFKKEPRNSYFVGAYGRYVAQHLFTAWHKPKAGASVLTNKDWIDFGLLHCESLIMTPMELMSRGL